MDTALIKAKGIAGGSAGLARALGNVTSQAISQWKRVPPERVADVSRVTGIPPHELRPDLASIFTEGQPA